MMDTKAIESCVENLINSNSNGVFPSFAGDNDAINHFMYNTAKRLTIYFEKFMSGRASKDVFLCSLRNYLLVFQNEMDVPEGLIPPENEYGILRNAEGKYYANLEMPDYIDSFFAEQAFQRKKVSGDTEKQKDIFYGNNAYIYGLTRYKEFKSLEQKLAVFGALNTPEGYTTLVSLPTGGGKSLITQTMAYQQQGLTIVIVPTVSLAIDQVRNAKNNIKHNADNEIFCYYSGIELERKNALRNAIKSETARLLFISPEALIRNTEFVSMINEANIKKYLKNLIVDEAHIAIEWGDFFRVDYQCLEPWHNELLAINSQLRTVLLSATFTKVAVTKLKQMFASAFMRELGGNDPLWSQRTRLIAYMEKISNRCCMPYIIGTERGLEKRIILEESWKRFLIDNMVYIRGWIQMKKIKYLQDRNPGVPGIIYKLEPENEKHRKLQKIRGLWTAVIEMSDIYDIYSGSHIEQNEYEIDHFVPWSFVTNDEMWNLIPVNPSLNASKRDKLPNWDRYFLSFAQNQFRLNQMVYKYERLAHIFRECQRDNLNAAWSVEELYVKNIKNDQFCKVLESRLKPIYELARTQGYRIWMVGE